LVPPEYSFPVNPLARPGRISYSQRIVLSTDIASLM
jgi:hypothetical protein